MLPGEVKAFIIDDDPGKRRDWTGFVEANGGEVVGSVDNMDSAYWVVGGPEFPERSKHANTFVIDGNIRSGSHGDDGRYLFLEGYRLGWLHRVDTADGIGAVAIGSSIIEPSAVSHATGGNLSDVDDEEAAGKWARMLEPHPAEPFYPSEGVIERIDFREGFQFGEMLKIVIKPDEHPTLNVLSMSVKETVIEEEDESVEFSEDLASPTEMPYENFVLAGAGWRGKTDGKVDVDTHTVKAVVQAGGHVYVLRHSSVIDSSSWYGDVKRKGKTDKIAISSLDEIPDTYWESVGIAKPEL